MAARGPSEGRHPERPIRRWALGLLFVTAMIGATRWRDGVPVPPRPTREAAVDPHPGCLAACHQPHRVAVRGTLAPTLDATCLGCHSGTPRPAVDLGALKLPESLAGLASRHLQTPDSKSKPYRRSLRQNGKLITLRNDCSGCHDVHGKDPGMLSRYAFDERGQLLGLKPTRAAQVCFGCHAGPQAAPVGQADPDLGARFGKDALSSHTLGKGASDRPDLPSLQAGAFKGRLDCTSCHDNPDTAGPRGPHASPYPSLLAAPYGRERDAGTLGDQTNALCFRCHDRRSIESDRSFPLHREHLTGFTGARNTWGARRPTALGSTLPLPLGMRIGWAPSGAAGTPLAGFGEPTPCATCHDPHGSRKNPSLIRFDPAVVTRSSVGSVDFYRSGLGHGTCTLTCHGYDHVQAKY
ncbi:MAG TPA: cytochrome c3 family protein [Holophagaceae bacterium]